MYLYLNLHAQFGSMICKIDFDYCVGLKDIYTISDLFMSLFALMHPMNQLWWFIVHFLMGWKKGT